MKIAARLSSLMILISCVSLSAIVPPEPGDISATIPFEFVLDGKAMPAGNYLIRADEATGNVEICEDGVYCETVAATPTQARGKGSKARIVFMRDGARYYLCALFSDQGAHYEVTRIEDRAAGSPRASESTQIEARPLCIHKARGSGRALAWH